MACRITSGSLGLLDQFGGATAAYSLRRLSSGFSGAVARVRRSGDNAELNLTAEAVTNGALQAFCGTGDGFIKTWYDQSGNTNNATQTTDALQPQIVSSGSIITQASKPAIGFFVSGCSLTANALVGKSRLDAYVVKNTIDANCLLFSGGADSYSWVSTQSDSLSVLNGQYGGILFANDQQFTGVSRNDVYLALRDYKLEVHQGASTYSGNSPWAFFDIGAYNRIGSDFDYIGTIQEIVFYASDQSVNRAGIQRNINSYYKIY